MDALVIIHCTTKSTVINGGLIYEQANKPKTKPYF